MWSLVIPTFVLAYLGTALMVFVGAWVYRRRVLAQLPRLGLGDLNPQQVGYLHLGERLAVYASLAGLRGAELVRLTRNKRTLRAIRPLPPGGTGLDQAVHTAAADGVAQQALRADPRVAAAVGQLREELERAGLMLGPDLRRRARRGAWLMMALLVIGVVRIAFDPRDSSLVAYLGIAVLLVLIGFWVLVVRIPRRSGAADAMLDQLRRTHAHLAVDQRPALRTYGPGAGAMAVALFGTGVLGFLDKNMGDEARIEHEGYDTGRTGMLGAWDSRCNSYGGESGGGDGGGGGGGGGGGCGGGSG